MKETAQTCRGKDKIVDESGTQKIKKKEDFRKREYEVDPHNFCFVCKDGGLLLHCDYKRCNKAYHPDCIGKDNKFLKRKKHWFCDSHICSYCGQSPEFQCLCCSVATCNNCFEVVEHVPVKGDKEFCSDCFKLALHVEQNMDPSSDTARVAFFREFWKINKCLTLEDLRFAYARMKEGKCYLSSSDAHKHDKNSLIYDSEIDYPIKKRQKCTITGSIGGQAIIGRDSSTGIKTGSNTDDGPGQGNNQNNSEADTKGGQDIMDRGSPEGIQFGSYNDDGMEQENYQKNAEKFTEGDLVLSKCLSSRLEDTMRPTNIHEVNVERDESCAGKDIEVHKGIENDGPDEQLEAILKSLPYGSDVASSRKLELGDRANLLWYCIVSDGMVRGPCPLSFLRSYADFDSACLRYKVWIAGQSRETAITLGQAFDLLSQR